MTPAPKIMAAPIMPLLNRDLAASTFAVSSPAYIYVTPVQIINIKANTPLIAIKKVLTLNIMKSKTSRVMGRGPLLGSSLESCRKADAGNDTTKKATTERIIFDKDFIINN